MEGWGGDFCGVDGKGQPGWNRFKKDWKESNEGQQVQWLLRGVLFDKERNNGSWLIKGVVLMKFWTHTWAEAEVKVGRRLEGSISGWRQDLQSLFASGNSHTWNYSLFMKINEIPSTVTDLFYMIILIVGFFAQSILESFLILSLSVHS